MFFDHFSDGYACRPMTRTRDLGILDSGFWTRKSGPEILRSRSMAPKSRTRKCATQKCATRKCVTQNMHLLNMHLGNTHLGNSGLGTRKYRTQDM